jgi:hypothetical protein
MSRGGAQLRYSNQILQMNRDAGHAKSKTCLPLAPEKHECIARCCDCLIWGKGTAQSPGTSLIALTVLSQDEINPTRRSYQVTQLPNAHARPGKPCLARNLARNVADKIFVVWRIHGYVWRIKQELPQ